MNNPKVILITGGAKRLGAALVKSLHAQQYNIILHYRHSKQDAEHLANMLNAERKNSVKLLPADFSQSLNYQTLIDDAIQPWRRLDGLINNASSFYPTQLSMITESQWDDLFASNAKAPLFLSQAALPYLQKTQGCIINIIDIYGSKPLKNYLVYSMAKASLLMLTKGLALECAPLVRVNAVSPGTFLWPEGENVVTETDKEKIIGKIPLQRQGRVEDITVAVNYLLQAKYVTGQNMAVDGGRSMAF